MIACLKKVDVIAKLHSVDVADSALDTD